MPECVVCGQERLLNEDPCPHCGDVPSIGGKGVNVPMIPLGPAQQPVEPEVASGEGRQMPGVCIVLKRGGVLTEHTFPVSDGAILGRFDLDTGPVDVDLAMLPESSYVSRHHSQICQSGGGWVIRDLGSSNGTFVKRQADQQFTRITGEHPLASGDEFALGNVRFQFVES